MNNICREKNFKKTFSTLKSRDFGFYFYNKLFFFATNALKYKHSLSNGKTKTTKFKLICIFVKRRLVYIGWDKCTLHYLPLAEHLRFIKRTSLSSSASASPFRFNDIRHLKCVKSSIETTDTVWAVCVSLFSVWQPQNRI